jgi:tRNA(Ile)-lysidine synthase
VTPLTAGQFDDLMAPFAPFEAKPVLAVAVSGGRDSMALAVLASDWARARGGEVLALTVDHGLRAEAAAEAAATAMRLSALGIAAEILAWDGPKPASGLQKAARAARYRLQLDACHRHGILHLLVAHHAGDQSETIAMRAARASGLDGLAGMAAVVEHRSARLLRPLLDVPRDWLTATLVARGVTWVEDPSNEDRRFERVRIRQDARARWEGAERLSGERAGRERQVASAALDALEITSEGVALDQLLVSAAGMDTACRLLGRVVQAVAGLDYPPRRRRLERAAARLLHGSDRGKSGKSQDFTLSGCRLMLRQEPGTRRLRWIVRPESGRRCEMERGQPLVPAAFFACGAKTAPHVG